MKKINLIIVLLTILFVTLHLGGIVTWGWIAVLTPFYFYIFLPTLVLGTLVVMRNKKKKDGV
jgi:hypothetical protein